MAFAYVVGKHLADHAGVQGPDLLVDDLAEARQVGRGLIGRDLDGQWFL